jgi:acyl-CoA thioester hydrolase
VNALRVPLRWSDVDALGHVGHGAVLGCLEEGRDAFLGRCGIDRREYVIGRCSVTYHREILLAHRHVDADCAVARLGRSSLTTQERLLDEAGEVLVEATFGLVLWDPDRHAARPISPGERTALAGAPAAEAAR